MLNAMHPPRVEQTLVGKFVLFKAPTRILIVEALLRDVDVCCRLMPCSMATST